MVLTSRKVLPNSRWSFLAPKSYISLQRMYFVATPPERALGLSEVVIISVDIARSIKPLDLISRSDPDDEALFLF